MTASAAQLASRAARNSRTSPLRVQLSRLVAVVVALDVVVILAALTVAWLARMHLTAFLDEATGPATIGSMLTPVVFAVWMGCLAAQGAYIRHNFGSGVEELRRLLYGSALAFGIVCALAFLTHSGISRGYFLLCFAIGTPLLLAERFAVRKTIHQLRNRGLLRGRVIVVCAPGALTEVLDTFARDPHAGYSVVGTCVAEYDATRDVGPPVPCYGGIEDVLAACQEAGADTVMVAGGGSPTSRALREIGWELEGTGIDLIVVPSLIDVAGPRIHMRRVSGLPLVHVEEPQAGQAGGFPKRLFDVMGSASLLVVFSPLLLWTALRVKLHDGGPVLFRHRRIGWNGEEFDCLKFRTMVPNAESLVTDLQTATGSSALLFKLKDDPRITKPGRWMRRYSVDELPQLLNVLRGDMSLVGPRPQVQREVELYDRRMSRRLKVRPGMTGLWQVSGRNDLSVEDSVRLDLYYVENWSMTQDLAILARTFSAVVGSEGAY